ncbi:MAG: hypothetical protein ACXWJ1_02925 [Caldimonas sp.]
MQAAPPSTSEPPARSDDIVFRARGLTKTYRTGEVEVQALREVDLDGIGEAYAAMDERRAIKSLVRVGSL